MRSAWEPVFFEALTRTGDVSRSARIAGVSRALVYRYNDDYAKFAQRWNAALVVFERTEIKAAMERMSAELSDSQVR